MGTCDWYAWNGDTSTTSSCTTWQKWVVIETGTSSVSNTTGTWVEWNGNTFKVPGSAINTDGTWGSWTFQGNKIVQATQADVAAHERRVAENRRLQEEYSRKRTAAAQRAERLLLELLDEEQTKEYRENRKVFHVVAANGDRYQVDAKEAHGNLKRLDANGKAVESLCVPLGDSCPTADHVVAQLLALRFNIDHLLAKANRQLILPDGSRRMIPRAG